MKKENGDNWVEETLKGLSVKEKAALCSGADYWRTKEIQEKGIREISMADGPHGVRCTTEADNIGIAEGVPSTCFPTASALGSSWDRTLMREIGEALAKECRELGVDILLGPGINMKRSPLCGRNFEYFSEDPYHTGELAAELVNGIQDKGIGTSLKHFACNNSEYERMTISSEVDERTLREVYLSAFERVIKKAKPWTVMCAYNRINGIPASEHRLLLEEILRKEWGFSGAVISDWGAVSNRVRSIRAGVDLEMPGPAPYHDREIIEAIESGELTEAELDQVVRRNLEILLKIHEEKGEVFDRNEHHELARRAASECVVLLKNEGGILPLPKEEEMTVAVIGKMGIEPRYQGAGSSKVTPTMLDNPLEELKKLGGEKILFSYAEGYSEDQSGSGSETLINEAERLAEKADVAILFVGLPESFESEGADRKHIFLPKYQDRLIKRVAAVQKNTIVVLSNGSAVAMPWVDNVPAILEGWLSGQGMGKGIAEILFGNRNPSGKLSETFPKRVEDNPSYLNFPGEHGKVRYGEGIFIGYRYYDRKSVEPLFPFGHGLSYTSFGYSGLKLREVAIEADEPLELSITVKNEGGRAGAEVVQLYLRELEPTVEKPIRVLWGFEKVYLLPGEKKEITFQVEPRAFSSYDIRRKSWVTEGGTFQVEIGSSSRDILLDAPFYVMSGNKPGLLLTSNSLIKEWLEDEKGNEILKRELSGILDELLDPENPYREMLINIPFDRIPSLSRGKIGEEVMAQMLHEVKNPDCRSVG